MALDGAFLHAIKSELMPLINGRVDKIYQPSREEIIISIRTHEGAKKLYISAILLIFLFATSNWLSGYLR